MPGPITSVTPAPSIAAPAPPDFAAIYQAEIGYLWRFLRHIGVPERDLEDVAHDTFMVLHRRLAAYDPSRPMRPWLTGIAIRVASDYRRRGFNRREHAVEAPPPRDTRPGAESQLIRLQSRERLLAALDQLNHDQRVVFVLHDIEERPIPEISENLGLPINTLYSRLRRARDRFTRAVRRQGATGGKR